MNLSPTEIFNQRKIFLIGGTGFLGKVALSMLLYRFPNIGSIYLSVRARSKEESEARFWNNVITAPPFDPLRERYGAAFEDFIKDKIRIVSSDVGETNLGFTEEEAQKIANDIDVVLNSAGNVTFSPPLETALRTNVVGTQNVIAFVKRMKRPALVHVSTCFVAGNRSGPVFENDEVLGYFPRRDALPGVEFSAQKEIEDAARLAERVREDARDALQTARFREAARKRLLEEGRDADDLDAMGLAVARERKLWIRDRLTELGTERARWWGWPNIYTYTKSLGEQLVAAESGIVKTIVRPSIVESAIAYPFPGWNEGFTTTAPLIFLTLKGQAAIPVNEKLILDITPVDQVVAVMLAACAETMARDNPRLVYQAATGDTNPNDMKRIVGLVGLYKRKDFQERETGNKIINQILARMEAHAVTPERFDVTGAPMLNELTKRATNLLDRVRPRWGGGRLGEVIERAKTTLDEVERKTRETKEAFELFRPFMVENAYIFRSDNVRALWNEMRADERQLLVWNPEKIDWYDYWMNVHFPGLKKWVFPTLEDEMRVQEKRLYTYRDLLELFETSTKRFSTRVAMRIERDGRHEQYTYADLHELATRAAAFLAAHEIKPGDRVLLISRNMPEWGMSYFGVMRAGAICVPVDPESSTTEIVNFTKASEAKGIIVSAEIQEKHPTLAEDLRRENLQQTQIWNFDEVFALPDEKVESERIALLPNRVAANSVASLIFTSGTTGQPKAVMLSHKNFANMVSMLASVLDMTTSDGALSVLPLHHTFEFSAGFLTPLSRGAQITYLDEVNGEELARAIKNGHVTGMVGVPALWELLHRRIKNRFRERGERFSEAMDLLIRANSWLRNNTPLNLGQLIFRPIHQGMGGRIRYLISGGSALNEQVKRDFHGLGFTILEGYGLTEAAPVLTVARPQNKLLAGSVGRALPGVEVKILEPDESGVGEIIARGANVMVGYYNNDAATKQTLIERWLRTGDLGRLDEDGNLYIVGRSKDVIIDTNGKNVYPDEIEELYMHSPFIKELSVVGLQDGLGEKVACLVVPDYDVDIALSRDEVRRRIEQHFRDISSTLPFFKRVKVLHFTDSDLPRTATRKVKRREIVRMLERLEEEARNNPHKFVKFETQENGAAGANDKGDDAEWLFEIIARVSNRPRAEISLNSRLSELGFDSLMYVELASAVEAAGGKIKSPDALNNIQDVRELFSQVTRDGTNGTGTRTRVERFLSNEGEAGRSQSETRTKSRETDGEIYVPSFIRSVGGKGLEALQSAFYHKALHTHVEGASNVPVHTNFLVAANHTSHLDMGLVKMALGEQGKDLVALAAADYFFDNKLKRAYMNNFTNLVPMERSGSLRQSLRHATDFLERGYNALIFPEGTRSVTGEMAEFKPVIGYLALNTKTGILPVYIYGTYEAFPKGSFMLKSRDIGARIGRFLTYEELDAMTRGMSRSDAYKIIAAFVQHEIENLRDNARRKFDAESLRRQWKAERKKRNN